MSEPFIGEIRIFAYNFAPRSWAFCDGQLLPIANNTALFSILGTTYGGDGRTTFGLPDLRGRVPIHPGRGPGLTPYSLGQRGGAAEVTLTSNQLPNHTHTIRASSEEANEDRARSKQSVLARSHGGEVYHTDTSSNLVEMAPDALEPAGSSQAHNNQQPFLDINFCIALQGLFPSRG